MNLVIYDIKHIENTNKLKHALNVNKKLYYKQYFTSNINNMKNTRQSFPSKIDSNDKTLTNTSSIANALNSYFASTGTKLASTFPTVSKSFQEFLGESQCKSIYLSPVIPEGIDEEMGNLSSNKENGRNNIPTKFYFIRFFIKEAK